MGITKDIFYIRVDNIGRLWPSYTIVFRFQLLPLWLTWVAHLFLAMNHVLPTGVVSFISEGGGGENQGVAKAAANVWKDLNFQLIWPEMMVCRHNVAIHNRIQDETSHASIIFDTPCILVLYHVHIDENVSKLCATSTACSNHLLHVIKGAIKNGLCVGNWHTRDNRLWVGVERPARHLD